MTDAIEINLGRKPEQLSACAGYCSEANLEALENRNIDAYVATGRARDAVAGPVTGEATAAQLSPNRLANRRASEAMRAKIKAGGHTSPYRLRKAAARAGVPDRSNRPAVSASSCCAASKKCAPSGPSSAPSTTSSSWPRGGICPKRRRWPLEAG